MHESVLVIAGIVALLLLVILYERFALHREETPARGEGLCAEAATSGRVRLLVRGWSEEELLTILGRFRGMYEAEIGIAPREDDLFEAVFPHGISPANLAFLVNYLAYPEEFEPDERDIAVLARVELCPQFGLPDPALAGQAAEIYVPEGDAEGDLVHLRLADGQTFRIPFTDMRWHPTGDARWPAELDNLAARLNGNRANRE